ncbi:hypothetical protein DOK78_002364 [Enterococcus sp. DIV2402]|uniref:Phage tail protein n=1 Tax=Candidatus Enterococcus lowellii TaxID=2230877 RepID=A0ABZ2SRE6_9ENTE|nr:major tail protein [Enterococcus sp. DIV2402]MBO0463517.1 phage tail protein [Enterococcus sp. DIV2402]
MATIGFSEAIFKIGTQEFTVNKASGGAIEASISGLGSPANTVYASNVPFYTVQKGTGAPEVELQIADLLDGGLYDALLGAKVEDGITILGEDTQAPYTSLILIAENKEGKRQFFGLPKGKFTAPDTSMSTTGDGGGELNTDTISGTFVTDNRGITYLTAVESATVTLAKFKEKVNGKTTP